ncbi:FecR family protein [Novipirellula caenicola]|uniref:FecR protein domain-containing protein n=1 Tax=Novipirellula caenicola TaxID=1536901 RepID=A0ABP9VXG1_9BACT
MTRSENRNDDRQLHQLLSKLVDGSITDSEHLDLQDRLRDDADAQQIYFNYLDLDTDLRQMTHGAAAVDPSPQINRSLRFWVAIAASVLMIASLIWWNDRDPVEEAIPAAPKQATLLQSAGGVFFRDVMPGVGEPLKSNHEYALTSGMIELRFPSGAEVILDAPAVIEIASQDRLIVQQGSCSVYAPDGAEGFQVITPKTEITDLGTRFSVDVDEVGDTEVQVVEGAAEVQPRDRDDSEKILLTERQASRFNGGNASSVEFQPRQYRHQLPDRVVEFSMGNTAGKPNGQLQSVTVQRGGTKRRYDVSQLIGIEVTHFRGGTNSQHMSVAIGDTNDSGDGRRAVIESDRLLHTGFLNLGGGSQPLTSDPLLGLDNDAETTLGMAIRFRSPVVNAPGPDVVFFELQSVLNPADGDAFHVSPLRMDAGLHSQTITRYDITLNSPEALSIPDFELLQFDSRVARVSDLLEGSFTRMNPSIPFWAIAVGIDLSDLGYPPNAVVEGLFFQDARDDDQIVDPVFIAGFPAELPPAERPTP